MEKLKVKIKNLIKNNSFFTLIYKVLRSVLNNGILVTISKIKRVQSGVNLHLNFPTDKELAEQSKTVFERAPKISVLVPLYNTPKAFLQEMIASVLAQSYQNWELCLADGSDAEHTDVRETVKSYLSDSRIHYQTLKENLGISENTNACLSMASGEYIALLDHDDVLHPSAFFYVIKEINEKKADFIYTDECSFQKDIHHPYWPHFKPDFSPDTLRSYNYICHLSVFSKSLFDEVGHFRKEFDGSQDYDLFLRLSEKATKIVHIPQVLYYWRSHAASVAMDISAKPYVIDAAHRALQAHLERVGLQAQVLDSKIPSTYRIRYDIPSKDMVSIIIPNKDHISDLSLCIDSVLKKTTYPNYEIIVVENNSEEPKTFSYYETLKADARIRVVEWIPEKAGFNYSDINNYGASFAQGKYLILLNNDVEILTPSWIEEMLMFCQRKEVGAAGMMLYYPDDTVQHAGVILGIGGVAGHSHKGFVRGDGGYASRMSIAQNLSAVTAAAMMIRKNVFDEVGGFDTDFAVAFNDIDLCMKLRDAGYLIAFTPYAEAYHYESKSRGLDNTFEKERRFHKEISKFHSKWHEKMEQGDPYYNPNLTLEEENFHFKNAGEKNSSKLGNLELMYSLKRQAAKKIANIFFCLALIFGSLFIFLEPPFVCPDEGAHYLNLCRVSNGRLFAAVEDGKIGSVLSAGENDFFQTYAGRYNGQTNTNDFDYQTMKALTEQEATSETVFLESEYATINPLAYLLPALGVVICKLLCGGLNAYTVLLLGKLINLFFYAFVIRSALIRTNAFRNTMFLLGLMPMALFQGASLSYDAYLIPAAFLLFACFTRILAYPPERTVTLKDLIFICFSVAVISGVKIAYLPLLLVLLAIPVQKYGTKKRFFLCVGCVLVCVALTWGIPTLANALITRNVQSAVSEPALRQKEYLLSNLGLIPKILVKTQVRFGEYWADSFFGILGWLDTPFPKAFGILFWALLLLVTLNDACSSEKVAFSVRILSAVGTFIFYAGTVLALYLQHNPIIEILGGEIAYGVQGRYFIPVYLFVALIFSNTILSKTNQHLKITGKLNKYIPVISLIFLNLTVFLLLVRYW